MRTRPDTLHFSRERELVQSVARYLRNRTFRRQLNEVPFYEYRMDMYGYSRRNDETVAVELKLKRWNRAFEQGLLYQLCSDFVYIAMPSSQTGCVDLALLENHGLGLLAVQHDRCDRVLQPKHSRVLRPHYREHCMALVCGGL